MTNNKYVLQLAVDAVNEIGNIKEGAKAINIQRVTDNLLATGFEDTLDYLCGEMKGKGSVSFMQLGFGLFDILLNWDAAEMNVDYSTSATFQLFKDFCTVPNDSSLMSSNYENFETIKNKSEMLLSAIQKANDRSVSKFKFEEKFTRALRSLIERLHPNFSHFKINEFKEVLVEYPSSILGLNGKVEQDILFEFLWYVVMESDEFSFDDFVRKDVEAAGKIFIADICYRAMKLITTNVPQTEESKEFLMYLKNRFTLDPAQDEDPSIDLSLRQATALYMRSNLATVSTSPATQLRISTAKTDGQGLKYQRYQGLQGTGEGAMAALQQNLTRMIQKPFVTQVLEAYDFIDYVPEVKLGIQVLEERKEVIKLDLLREEVSAVVASEENVKI
eukprot:snap_masked-scaffold_6-processed-gene-10.14-mRNA-1 protein AED:1.00 eAED:1.00 QI:0/-1/0/0/-1/1/1/0/388